MELGIQGRSAIAIGSDPAMARACADALLAEGVTILEPGAALDTADIVIATLQAGPALDVSDLDDEASALTRAWRDVSALCDDLRSVLPAMARRGFGRIIFIGPIAAKSLDDAAVVDRVVGLGMLGLQKNLAGEFGEDGITANSLLYARDAAPGDALLAAAAAACTYLASRQAAYLTGTVMTIDAGRQRSVF